jgi:membrane fusion protein (multidrug efflux system)
VTIRSGQDGQWVVTGGLQAGDRVIVDGFQKMFVPGAPVKPVPWQPAARAAPASAPIAAPGAAPQAAATAASR